MQAADEAAVGQRLRDMGYTLTGVHPRAASRTDAPARSAARVSHAARARFLRQLASTQRAGMPLYNAIVEIERTVADHAMGAIAHAIGEQVQRGGRLSEAFAAYPRVFSPGAVGLVAAAETGGFLDRALADLAGDAERAEQVRRQIARATWRVRVSLGVYLFLGLPLAFFVGPLVRTLLSTGDRAQAVAAGVQAGMRQLFWVGGPVLAGLIGLKLALSRLAEAEGLARLRDEWLLRLPVIGAVHGCQARAEFLTTLGRLTHAGLGPSQSWETASGAVENRAARERILGALPSVVAGGRFSDALAAAGVCTVPEVGLVANGEQTGTVDETLGRLAENYHWRLEDALRRLPVAAQALATVLVAPLVIYVVATFYRSYYGAIFQSMDDGMGS